LRKITVGIISVCLAILQFYILRSILMVCGKMLMDICNAIWQLFGFGFFGPLCPDGVIWILRSIRTLSGCFQHHREEAKSLIISRMTFG